MNGIDVIIILLVLGALTRGATLGFARQASGTAGFIVGLLIGSWASTLVLPHISGSGSQTLASLCFVLLGGLIGMTAGEIAGIQLKLWLLRTHRLDRVDGWFGSILAACTILLAVWLGASILVLGPSSGLQQALKNSRILGLLNADLPPATSVLGSLNQLIDPNGFPEVFKGLEPSPTTQVTVPDLGSFNTVVASSRASVVKVAGTGCGGIVEGSGFVIAPGEVATNAHVVAGIRSPKIIDENGVHNTQVMWFDPDIDLAVLKTTNLAGKPLAITSAEQANGTPGVVLGYPGGGNFTAESMAIIDRFTALGRNIYGQGTTTRDVYSLQAHIIPGNSGGPVIGADGQVLGIVFATSTTYNNVGYALTGHQVAGELATAEHSTTVRSTGECSE